MLQKVKFITTRMMAVAAMVLIAGAVALPFTSAYADTCDPSQGVGGSVNNDCAGAGSNQKELFGADGVFTIIINVVLFLVGAISVIMLIYGGIKYTTSAGDTAKVTSAKNTIMYAIVGLIVAILAYAIVNFVVGSFSGN
ncbi:MAG: pilin [Candidatus Nomurabacteria bacterium]|jgi:multisubunit Na+/H+ antiporter MnhB subunit|nr:pilin [Candidatus Nomurabacteria bacterium]